MTRVALARATSEKIERRLTMITATSKNPQGDRGLTRGPQESESPLKDDRHLTLLRLIAQHKQRELRRHDASGLSGNQLVAQRRQEQGALRARGHVEAAEARRMPQQLDS